MCVRMWALFMEWGAEYLVRHRHQLILIGVLMQGAGVYAVNQFIVLIWFILLIDKAGRSLGYFLYLSLSNLSLS